MKPPRIPALEAAALALVTACAHGAPRATPPVAAVAVPAPATPSPRGAVPAPAPAPPVPPRVTGRVSLAAVGDVLMHDAVKRSATTHGAGAPNGGYAWLFEPVADLLSRADVAFANLETPIAPGKGGGTREFVFNASPDVVRALQRSGVDLVSVTNNHAFDQGRPGFEETLAVLDRLGMRRAGAGPADRPEGPEWVEVGGLRIAVLAWAHFFNQDGNECPTGRRAGAAPCLRAAQLDRDRAVEAVRAAARAADAVVVSLHWGDEYQQQPRADDVELAHRLAEAGAAVIIGHHPHVLQPIELYRRPDGRTTVIAYSLGNFVSNQSRGYVYGVTPERAAATRDGALLEVDLVRTDYGRGVVQVDVGGAGYVPLWTENDTAEIDARREPGRRPRIRVVAVERALASARAALLAMPDPVPADRQPEWVRLRRAEALLLARKEAIGRVLGADLERSVPPPPPPAPGTAPAAATPAPAP
ncbi:MAG TPA: CapA family protein [Anaeromyxobacteraceae bacterium]|nr:CapA family protein [Anaeromyxobacteraceae bacterium]